MICRMNMEWKNLALMWKWFGLWIDFVHNVQITRVTIHYITFHGQSIRHMKYYIRCTNNIIFYKWEFSKHQNKIIDIILKDFFLYRSSIMPYTNIQNQKPPKYNWILSSYFLIILTLKSFENLFCETLKSYQTLLL